MAAVCYSSFFIGEGREGMFSKRSVFNCFLVLALLAGLGACQPPPTATTPPETTTPLAAAPTDTPAPSKEVPVYDLGPIPGVDIQCLFQRQGESLPQQETSTDGSWRQFRHNAKLTGRSPLTGDIACPKLLWAYDLGVRQTWVAITPDSSSESEIELPVSGETGDRWSVHDLYEIEGFMISLDQAAGTRVLPSGWEGEHKIGDFLPELPGYERISCETGVFQIGAEGDDPLPCYLQNWNGSQWETVWTSQPFGGFSNSMSTNGEPIVGDFDNDGELETAVLPWYDMHILDLATGRLEQTANFQDRWHKKPDDPTTGRPYGFFGAYNLDDDPKSEFVILGDFEKFVSVFGWKDGKLVELWDHQIEAGTFLNKTAHRTGVNPVVDIDGDGLPEIVTTIYNEYGDQRWHIIGFDGMSGEVKLDLVDSHLSGLGDLDGDGVVEIFTTTTSGQAIPNYGPSTIYSFLNGSLESIWHSESLGFESYDLPSYPDNVNSRATYGRRTMFLRSDWTGGDPVFITREKDDTGSEITLHFYQMVGGTITEIGSVRGPNLKVKSFPSSNPDSGILIEATTPTSENRLQLSGLKAEVLYSGRTRAGDGHPAVNGSLLTGTVVGPMRSGDPPTIITQGYGEQIQAFKYSEESGALEQIWQVSGRGMLDGSNVITANGNGYASVLLADLTGSGDLAVIAASKTEEGFAMIKALDADGQSIWESTFEVPGDPPIWNVAGITNWAAGHFTSTDHEDIMVSVRATEPRSYQLFLLEGRSGEVLWAKSMGGYFSGCSTENPTGAGGSHMAALDWDGDGLDEVLNLLTGLFAVYDGSDGSTLFNRWTTTWCPDERQLFSLGFRKHPTPVVSDFLGDGSDQILLAGMDPTIAVVQFDGSVVWHTPFFSGSPINTMQGVGDLNGDSTIDLVSVGHCNGDGDEIQILNARDGTLQWSLSMPELCDSWLVPTHVSTVDLDGDGRDEALFTHKNNIYAIGVDPGAGAVLLWQVRVEPDEWLAQLSEVVVADVDGSGRPQLIVNTASGYIYGFSGQPFPTPTPTLSPDQEISTFIYDDALAEGWDMWTWNGEADAAVEGVVHSGQKALGVTLDTGGGIGFKSPLNFSEYDYLEFYVNGGSGGGQKLDIYIWDAENDTEVEYHPLSEYTSSLQLPPDEWFQVRIPLQQLDLENKQISLNIPNASDQSAPQFFLDDIRLISVVE